MNLRSSLLLLSLLCVTGCASPETMSGIGTRIFAAVPGLSYANGDVDEGTTTFASLPLLSYCATEEHPGYYDSEAWIVPLLGRFAQTDRYVELTWDEASAAEAAPEGSGAKAQGPPPDWWDRYEDSPRKRRKRRKPAEPRTRDPEPDAPRSKREKGKGGEGDADLPSGPAPKGTAEIPGKSHLRLRVDRPGRIVKQLPQQKTQWDILFGLIGHHAERPARVLVRPARGGKERKGSKLRKGDVLYEVGPTRDSFRLLPLFSYRRGPEGNQFMFWPLLLGYEREGSARYARVFYFLKIPID